MIILYIATRDIKSKEAIYLSTTDFIIPNRVEDRLNGKFFGNQDLYKFGYNYMEKPKINDINVARFFKKYDIKGDMFCQTFPENCQHLPSEFFPENYEPMDDLVHSKFCSYRQFHRIYAKKSLEEN